MEASDLKWLIKQYVRRDQAKIGTTGKTADRFYTLMEERLKELGEKKGEDIKRELGLAYIKAHVYVDPALPSHSSQTIEPWENINVILLGGKNGVTKQDILDSARHELSHIITPRKESEDEKDPVQNALYELRVYNAEKRIAGKEWSRIKRKREFGFYLNYWNDLDIKEQAQVKSTMDSVFRSTKRVTVRKPIKQHKKRVYQARRPKRSLPSLLTAKGVKR